MELKDYDFCPAYHLLYESIRGNFSSLTKAIIENLEYFMIQKEHKINGYGVFINNPEIHVEGSNSKSKKILTNLIRNREINQKNIRIDTPKALTILINSCQSHDMRYGRSLLCLATQYNNQGDIVKLLVNKGANVNYVDYNGTALNTAFKQGNILAMNILILDPKIIATYHFADLSDYCDEKAAAFLNILLSLVKDVNQQDGDGRTILDHLVAQSLEPEKIKLLLDQGADPNLKNLSGNAPIHYVSDTLNFEIIKILIDHGADPNILDSQGNTPLHLIVTSDYISGEEMDSIKYLLTNGADVSIKNHDNLNVIELAKKIGDFRYSCSESGIFEEIATDQPNDNHNRLKCIKVRGYAHYIPIWQEEIRSLRKKSQPTQMQVEEVLSDEVDIYRASPFLRNNLSEKRKINSEREM